MHPSVRMFHVTFSCHGRRWWHHTSPRVPISTSSTVNDTLESMLSTSFLLGSTRHHTSSGQRMEKRFDVALPGKNLAAWHPGATHVSLCGHYGKPCFIWRHWKTRWIRHVFTCLRCVFLLFGMTNFRWRPGGELLCQMERARPFFLTSQKTWFSYSV